MEENLPSSSEAGASVAELRRLSARSVILSVLLGAHPPEFSVADIVGAAAAFGIQPVAARVALSRMVAVGELERTQGSYRLTPPLLGRQERQDRRLAACVTEPWDRRWRTVVVVSSGDSAAARAALRATMREKRFAELREGVWLRPDNLEPSLSPEQRQRVEIFTAVPETEPKLLADKLFGLDAWAEAGDVLVAGMQQAHTPIDRLTVAAAIVRHLLTDPLMPAELLDEHWPAGQLRSTYHAFTRELIDLRETWRTTALT